MRRKIKTTFPANFGLRCGVCGLKPNIDPRDGSVRWCACERTGDK
jgi:hypothetical protein